MANPRMRYGKSPGDVLTDKNLSDKGARLFGILAMHAFEGGSASIGVRRLAELLPRSSKSEIHRRIKELEGSGHLTIKRGTNGQRSFYVLNSPVFGQKQGKETIIRSLPSGAKRMVSVAAEDVA